MATNSQLFTGLALPISPSASLQQASPLILNSFCRAERSLTTPFLSPGSGLGTLKINNARVAASYQSRGGRHSRFLLRGSFFDEFVKSLADGASSLVKNLEKLKEKLDTDFDPGMDDEFITIQRLIEQVTSQKDHFETLYKVAHKISEQWHRNAQVLLRKGEEDLARVALKRWITFDDDAKEMKRLFEEQRDYGCTLLNLTKPFADWMHRAVAKERGQAASTATKLSATAELINTLAAMMSEDAMGKKLETDELDKKYALESTHLDDDRAFTIFKEELALAAAPTKVEVEYQLHQLLSPLNDMAMEEVEYQLDQWWSPLNDMEEVEYQLHRWWSPFNDMEVQREIMVLRQEIEEGK